MRRGAVAGAHGGVSSPVAGGEGDISEGEGLAGHPNGGLGFDAAEHASFGGGDGGERIGSGEHFHFAAGADGVSIAGGGEGHPGLTAGVEDAGSMWHLEHTLGGQEGDPVKREGGRAELSGEGGGGCRSGGLFGGHWGGSRA